MTWIPQDFYHGTQISATDDGSGNGTWVFEVVFPEYAVYDPATIQTGQVYVDFYRGGAGHPSSGQTSVNGIVIDADISVDNNPEYGGLEYGLYEMWEVIPQYPTVTTFTVEMTGCVKTGAWADVFMSYRYYTTYLYPVYWINPLTGEFSESFEGSHRTNSTSEPITCPGYDYTVVNDYQIWGPDDQTYTRLRQRNDGLGTQDGTPPRIDTKASSQQNSIRVPGQNTYR